LSSFRVKRGWCNREGYSLRGWLFLGSRLLWCLNRLKGDFLSACCVTSPDETPAFILSYWMYVKNFIFEVFEVVVIEIKTSLESTIGHPSLALQ
jgi:hypothetical protein